MMLLNCGVGEDSESLLDCRAIQPVHPKDQSRVFIEFEEGVCRVNVSVEFKNFTPDKKDELIKVAKNKKNAAAVGIVGKIRSAIENFVLDEDPDRKSVV